MKQKRSALTTEAMKADLAKTSLCVTFLSLNVRFHNKANTN